MKRRALTLGLTLVGATVAYLLAWPVPVRPLSWRAPPNPGYVGPHAVNARLASATRLPLPADYDGPEDVAVDRDGTIYASTHQGAILRFDPAGGPPDVLADTGGCPLGLAVDGEGQVIVADGCRGLLAISPGGDVALLTDSADGVPIGFADDVEVAPDGTLWFTDASTRFSPAVFGGTLAASKLDMVEHGGNGRLLRHDPVRRRTTVIAAGLDFPNGVAIAPDGAFVLVAETGAYRLLIHHLIGPRAGTTEPFTGPLPGFPDNVETGRDGRFWVGLVSPRSAALDALDAWPFLRRVILRLPERLRPKERAYGHLLAFDAQGRVVADLQAPNGEFAFVTGAAETPDGLWITSLKEPALGRLPAAAIAASRPASDLAP